ncbi:MAG: DUF4416 family protein [Candidatus Omnitrophota bacterium]
MGLITKPQKVKLILGMIAAKPKLFAEAADLMSKKFGKIDYESPVLKFDYTDYYNKEMGSGLKRKFIGFKKLINQDDLAAIKIYTNKLEKRFAAKGKRRINLDPGFISKAKLILATTKDRAHRIYLKDGIYAEVTLQYRGGSFKPGCWAYPDYRTKRYMRIFNEIRTKL